MPARSSFVLALIAFACLVLVVEGRLFDPTRTGSKDVTVGSQDEAPSRSSESQPEAVQTFNSTDDAASKFASFVESSKNTTMCDRIHPEELPEECFCTNQGTFGLAIECLKAFNATYFNDTIGMKIDLDPCNENGAQLSLDVTEKEHNVDYTLVGINAGETKNIPIPGLAMIVPGIGNVGLDVAVMIAGNPDVLRLKVGLDACAQTSTNHEMCASSIPGLSTILPWYVLKGTYSFGGICSGRNVAGADVHSGNDADDATTLLSQ
mmetsp:Transcript_28555/g.61205  ORF Transcript_28555/g.61205 Transcript_28555/m.61205 type:complete len:264 (-) Transcript_28555:163-954(-)|eukprot:CAMPEP_0201116136 /NCGR_PEP_ID=MMETSP0850-20130426/503_1 /ASSEMBLY_ACC=CAM_ASM_000622 /TAXON_ID=183588 /ORGANISM="Pseudo-nitzschia fraudulenta, Strain WWA7" /LENGTH=263 /DNA_ID=CAMNT_0047380141 /DNA_START=138 /DNA_END=929 /DNA_ORIENTATION=+